MNETDEDYIFHPNGDCDCSYSFNHLEEIIHRRSFFDIDMRSHCRGGFKSFRITARKVYLPSWLSACSSYC